MTASEPITTISDSALLMGCRCASRLIAPPTQTAAKMKKSTRCSIAIQLLTAALRQRHDQAGDHNIRDGQRQKKLPPEGHELVIAETRQRAADPDVNKDESENPQGKPENR